MLINRYPAEFDDDGNRALLPFADMGLGVSGYSNRWKASSITSPDGSAVGTWVDSVGGLALTAPSVNQPLIKTASGVRMLEFDGVDDAFTNTVFGANSAASTNPKSISLLVRIRSQGASVKKGIVNMGDGVIEVNNDASNTVLTPLGWFNGSGTGGGATGNTGNTYSPVNISGAKFAIIQLVAAHDGLHELSVGKTHTNWVDMTTPTTGMKSMLLGRSTGTLFAAMDVVETILWPQILTRANRDTIVDGLKLNYPSLTFAT